jgi:membrane associated rhomboid family serine protease
LACYFLFEYLFISSNFERVANRSILITDSFLNSKKYFIFCLSVSLAVGIGQLVLNSFMGDFDLVIYEFGGIYEKISDGEIWRIITASIFHSGFTHWIVNSLSLLFIIPIYITLTRNLGILTFIFGCIAGSISSYVLFILGLTVADAYVGFSAGVFSLMGYSAFFSFIYEEDSSLCFSIINFVIMSILLSYILSPSTSNMAHLSGFMVGSALVFLKLGIKRDRFNK